MTRFFVASLLAVGLCLATANLNTAQAQFGSPYGIRAPYCPGGGFGVPAYGYRSFRPVVSPFGVGYSSYYRSPALSVTRSSFYASPYARVSPYGLGGFGNLGYPGIGPAIRTGPRVQLRVGF